MDRLVILGTEWTQTDPYLLMVNGNAELIQRVPLVGFRMSYRARPDLPRVCIGHRTGAGEPVCMRRVQIGTRTCRTCAIEAARFASDVHHAHTRKPGGLLNEHLNQPNVLYVAAFGDRSVKVGTSVAHRFEIRLAEQGARHARIVARTEDGVVVRVLEELVTGTLAIPQTVSTTRKLRGLIDARPDAELTQLVDQHADEIRRLLDGMEGWEPLREEWWHPIWGDETWERVFQYPRDLGVGAHDLVAAGACGRIALLSRAHAGADRFVADLMQLYGLGLEKGVFDTPQITAQHTLF